MSNFLTPPTFREPFAFVEARKTWVFDPEWLRWFREVTQTLTQGQTVSNSGALVTTSVTMANGAGALAGTLLNAPAAGNPTKWIPINDNGTTRYIPAW